MRRAFSSKCPVPFVRHQAAAAAAATASAAPGEKSFFQATELIGYVHSIDGTIATVIPACARRDRPGRRDRAG